MYVPIDIKRLPCYIINLASMSESITRPLVTLKTQAEQQTRKPTKSLPTVQYTLCIPSTCISRSNAKSLQQVTHVAYQIAKAACIYKVGEIVVLQVSNSSKETEDYEELISVRNLHDEIATKRAFGDDGGDLETIEENNKKSSTGSNANDDMEYDQSSVLLAILLQFFVTPPYLIKSTFSKEMLKSFEYAKQLPKLSTLPFMQNKKTYKNYREGLTIIKKQAAREKTATGKVKKVKNKSLNTTRFVNIGEQQLFELVTDVPTNVRVTVDLQKKTIVPPTEAYGSKGARSAFGYHVRVSKSFTAMFTESGYPEGYDHSLYVNSGDYFLNTSSVKAYESMRKINNVEHNLSKKKSGLKILLVVAKWTDLVEFFEADKACLKDVSSVDDMFDGRVKIPVGSRVEDGILMALAKLC